MTKREEQEHSGTSNGLLIGLLAGTVVGVVTAALWNTPKAKNIKDNISTLYDDASEKIQEFSHQIHHEKSPRSSKNLNIAIGAIAGGILGVSAIYLMTSQSAKGVRQQLAHTFESLTERAQDFADNLENGAQNVTETCDDQIHVWVNAVQKFIDLLNSPSQTHHVHRKNENHTFPSIDKILDWAVIGARLFQSLKK